MTMTRRDVGVAALTAAVAAVAAGGHTARAAEQKPVHDMSGMPASWTGHEQIAFLIYPQFTALDMVGPHYMLTSLMGAKVHVVAATRDPVHSDAGLIFTPSATFEDCPKDLDIICVPGGTTGTLAAMQDESTLRFLKDRGSRAKFVTSVCTGSLIIGAAGLLDGYKATSHWVAEPVLSVFGATPVHARIVKDRNRITAGGVTSGIDFGLYLLGMLRDRTYAETVQLMAQYAPEPPYDSGVPERASPEVKGMVDAMFTQFGPMAETIGRASFDKAKLL